MKKYIEIGFTNKSYTENGFFYQEKISNNFNHKIDYSILKKLDFVPKFLGQKNNINKWELIDVIPLELNKENISRIAKNFRKIHESNLKFPPFNLAGRIKEYRKIMNDKKISYPEMEKYYKKVNTILRNMDKLTPCHNDLYSANILIEKNTNKMFFIDWEYSSCGDKHFDLAYFIESNLKTDKEESILLEAYEANYDYSFILLQRLLVNYLIVLWLHTFETPPFDPKPFLKKMIELDLKHQEWIKKN
ncbi:phosphotransferase [[Mycoplasma] mobile]|uniref:Predicted choline kinase n=1 Tax=Mycoplasma mobile (strain ATCC 43663 / 163K / NCTC 11711) TaxID=267748 RepID=Q6KH52_MYCM1|nr:phosphotransferase [[Mycoplasma] mobile]AAT28079.1 predicted choline kinase [Mycoplasma mobile 163K]